MDTPAAGATPAGEARSHPGDGTAILTVATTFAKEVAAVVGLQADEAGGLESNAATCASQIAFGAGTIQAVAYEQALGAAQSALRLALEIVEGLQPARENSPLTADQALRVVAAAQEASRQQTIAARAGVAYATAAAARELVLRSAASAATLERDLIEHAIAAQDVAAALTTELPLLLEPLCGTRTRRPASAQPDPPTAAGPEETETR